MVALARLNGLTLAVLVLVLVAPALVRTADNGLNSCADRDADWSLPCRAPSDG
eukprot:COSAG06_NODE_28935_length_565_cov_0.976395_1_plen_52_part_01